MQTPEPGVLEHLVDVVVAVDGTGGIVAVEPRSTPDGAALVEHAAAVVELGPTEVLLPGLVDAHIHAPQWPQLGTCLDLPLDQWLFDHTFPLEARYVDAELAAAVWADLVATLLGNGTTTAVYFGTNDEAATRALAAECLRQGQRALVGRVAMDHPTGTPAWYRDDSARLGVEASARSIDDIRALDAGRGLVQPIITPRFTPACTDELLTGLGALAAATGVAVQTHVSESDWAHGYALERFGVTDSAALDRCGLLVEHSVLAHANHITDDDARLLVERSVGIAHCPLSNAYFANGVLPVRRWLDAGVAIGLGTDVAGGASPSLLAQCQHAVTTSRLLEDGIDVRIAAGSRGVPDSRTDIVTAFWMATVGGAAAVGLPVGLIAIGRRFDAIVVDTAAENGSLRIWPALDDARSVFEKIVRLAGAGDITVTWVDGRAVAGRLGPRGPSM